MYSFLILSNLFTPKDNLNILISATSSLSLRKHYTQFKGTLRRFSIVTVFVQWLNCSAQRPSCHSSPCLDCVFADTDSFCRAATVYVFSCSGWFVFITRCWCDCALCGQVIVWDPASWHLLPLFSTEMLIIKHAPKAWLNVTQLPWLWPSLWINLPHPQAVKQSAATVRAAWSAQSHSAAYRSYLKEAMRSVTLAVLCFVIIINGHLSK